MKAYVHLMIGNHEQSRMFLEMAFESCNENKSEKSWLELSKLWWFTGEVPMEDCWLKTAPDFPVWKIGMSDVDLGSYRNNKFLLKMPEMYIADPLPETKSDEKMTIVL
ncbi:UNVERIFIED_CONTAM: hypothetical protein K2H54_046424 [Gekko kuhli]